MTSLIERLYYAAAQECDDLREKLEASQREVKRLKADLEIVRIEGLLRDLIAEFQYGAMSGERYMGTKQVLEDELEEAYRHRAELGE